MTDASGASSGPSLPGLGDRAVRATLWVAGFRIAGQGLGLARMIILARLLAPHDFGLFGIAVITLGAVEILSATGFEQALVQRSGDVTSYLDTAWCVAALRAALLCAVVVAVAPLVAGFFATPAATPMLMACAVTLLLRGLANPGLVCLQRELDLLRRHLHLFSGNLTDVVVSIAAAVWLRSAWALVLGTLAGELVRLVASYLLQRHRPRPRLDWKKARELHRFGRWVFGSNLLVYLGTRGDDIVLGRLLGTGALGLYQMAYRITNLPATELTHNLSHVMLPALSKLRDQPARQAEAFLRALDASVSATLPAALLFVVLGRDAVMLVLGERWLPMVDAFRILALAGFVRSVIASGGPVYLARSRPQLAMLSNVVRLGALAITIVPLTLKYGLAGTATAALLSSGAALMVWLKLPFELLGLKRTRLLRDLSPTLAASTVLGAASAGWQRLFGTATLPHLATATLLGLAIYALIQGLWWRHSAATSGPRSWRDRLFKRLGLERR